MAGREILKRPVREIICLFPMRGQKRTSFYRPARFTFQWQAMLARAAFGLSLGFLALMVMGFSSQNLGFVVQGIAPLTLILEILLALALWSRGVFDIGKGWKQWVFALVCVLSVIRLVEHFILSDAPLSHMTARMVFTPPLSHNPTAVNTAASLAFMSASGLVRRHHSFLGLLLAAAGFFPITVAALGYSYNHPFVYGAMTPVTLLILMMLGLSLLFSYSRSRFLRPFLTSSRWGNAVRFQALVTLTGIWLAGAAVQLVSDSGMFERGLAGAMWIVLIVTLASGPLFERIERDRRHLVVEMEKRARLDPLTGVLNRHGVRDCLVRLSEATKSHRRRDDAVQLGVILADVDHFKQVNDLCGHETGDRVLRHVAETLRSKLRSRDVVARWGGEEFLILLPGASEQQSYQVAQQLRVGVASQVAWLKNGCAEAITISIGVAEYDTSEDGATVDMAIQRADTALYQAKAQGRNRVKCFAAPEIMMQEEDELDSCATVWSQSDLMN